MNQLKEDLIGNHVLLEAAAVMAILAKRRGGVTVHKQLLFYQVTDAAISWIARRNGK